MNLVNEGNEPITIGEVARNVRDLRLDYVTTVNAIRSDTQATISRLEHTVGQLDQGIRDRPYVTTSLYEERAKSQGERIGSIEADVLKLEATLAKVNAVAWGAIVSLVVTIVGAVIVSGVLS